MNDEVRSELGPYETEVLDEVTGRNQNLREHLQQLWLNNKEVKRPSNKLYRYVDIIFLVLFFGGSLLLFVGEISTVKILSNLENLGIFIAFCIFCVVVAMIINEVKSPSLKRRPTVQQIVAHVLKKRPGLRLNEKIYVFSQLTLCITLIYTGHFILGILVSLALGIVNMMSYINKQKAVDFVRVLERDSDTQENDLALEK